MKAVLVAVLVFLLLGSSFPVMSQTFQEKQDLPDDFIIEDITMRDGGYHLAQKLGIEWWYFDANVNDNVSVQVGLMLLSRKNVGLVSPGINIYENGQIVYHKRNICSFGSFAGSEEKPLIYLHNLPYINGTINEETGCADYHVTLAIGDAAVSLHFNGTMRGWKSDDYAIIMPKATVSGTIMYNNQEVSVQGEGYHEHKWNMSVAFASETKGYYWGRILSNTTSLVYSEMFPHFRGKRVLAVLNIGTDTYVKINEDDFHFHVLEYETKAWKKTPVTFELSIHNETIWYDAIISTIGYHHVQLFTKNYWRYNVQAHGNVTVSGVVDERIDSKGIMEHGKFSLLFL